MKQYIYGHPRKCQICGVEFRPRDKASTAKYCSYACNNRSRRKHMPMACMNCGEQFTPIRSSNVFCSKKCGGKYKTEHYKRDPLVHQRIERDKTVRSSLHLVVFRGSAKWEQVFGYTKDEIMAGIEAMFEPWMSWENYGHGAGKWCIDHIRPVASYPLDAPISEINALRNLRPLEFTENCRKKKQ